MAIEEELREAIAIRNRMAVDLAVSLLQLTVDTGDGGSRLADHGIVGGKYAMVLADIEALTAAILQRCGMSWDAMAARVDMTRQALHRRLGARGEELFDTAVRASQYEELDRESFLAVMRAASAGEIPFPSIPVDPEDIREALESIPSNQEILSAPDDLAAELMVLRRTLEWWKDNW